MDKKECLKNIESFAEELLSKGAVCELQYHNIEHTKRVVRNAEFIGNIENVNDDQMFIIMAIAWFHDLGYTNCYDGHEDGSIAIAKKFLASQGVEKEIVEVIEQGINATRVPQKPTTHIEKIIADADLFDLGTDDYFELSEKLFAEWNECVSPESIEKQWSFSLNFLKEHNYFTPYGRDVLEAKKQENIRILERRLEEQEY